MSLDTCDNSTEQNFDNESCSMVAETIFHDRWDLTGNPSLRRIERTAGYERRLVFRGSNFTKTCRTSDCLFSDLLATYESLLLD